MPSIQEWFSVYGGIRSEIGELKNGMAHVAAALELIEDEVYDADHVQLKSLADDLRKINQHFINIDSYLSVVAGQDLPSIAGSLAVIAGQGGLNPAALTDPVKALSLAGFPGFEGESADKIRDALTALGQNPLSLKDQLALVLSVYLSPLMDSNAPVPKAMAALEKAMSELTKEGSPSLLDDLRAVVKSVHGNDAKLAAWIQASTDQSSESVLGAIAKKTEAAVTSGLQKTIDVTRPVLKILEAPFKAVVETALKEFTDAFEANAPADPDNARSLVSVGIAKAFELGQFAHFLAAAAEAFYPTKQLGLPQAAAAVGDLSGFKEISGALSRTLVAGSITRPMRWWGNDVFSPEILPVMDLVELVGKREIDLSQFARVLYKHGFTHDDVDLLSKAVWREPSIRDLAIAIEDTTVEDDWLLQRVRRAGYEDNDAEQLTRSLTQRSLKAARGRVISAALAAVTDGLLDTESYRAILESLQLRQDEIALQIRTAEISARRDTVNTAITTYKRSYVNGQIERSDFTLALTALGVVPDRVDLIALDADAQRQPRIAREEEAKIKAAVREIQTELVPRYRKLFELGVIDEVAYENILIEAGVSTQVAAQAVLLDKQKRQIVTQYATSAALERQTAALVAETETALRLQFRKGLIDEAQLKNSLLDLGYTEDRAGVIVNQERARLAQPPGRVIEAPAEAKERVVRDLAIQTALNDFRQGRTDALDLYDALVEQGMDEDEAVARVNLEISRLPVPTA